MWTYMMAAARGDRVNTMMSSRRRPEIESPKYGYNLSRPMYRTTRFVGATASAPAQLPYGGGGSSSTSSSCTAAQLPLPHEELEISGGLYAPFQPTGAVSNESVCLPRKHLIANQTAIPLPMGPATSAEREEQRLHYLRSSGSWQRTQPDYDEDDDEDDDDDVDHEDDEESVAAATAAADVVGYADVNGKDNQEEAIAPAEPKQMAPGDANYLENGRKLIQLIMFAVRNNIQIRDC
ncbi:GH19757 [Drosophila grimshawi]|uniref:GH19757 n=1 Tax=Drosophila grimshawi TaxID=7222 RepID=B4J455_DROGR|nr:GH19757 [Drosophila grimshawi]